MAETFLSNDDEEDKRETHWRKISKHLISELNEKILKRRQALSQNELPEDLSLLTSDEESTSVSRVLSDEYHRKKMMDAELKCKMLEGLDTLSETSSLSSSLCFQELDVEVPEEVDEKASTAENINSHNSGGDGRSDSDSVSYSTSFTGSIDEDCTSNVESNSSYVNAADSSSTIPPTIIDNNGINGMRLTDTVCASEECGTTSQENPGDKQTGFFYGDGENELNRHEKPGAEMSGFPPGENICIPPYESTDSERGDISNYSPEKDYSPTIPENTDHTLKYILSCGDRKDFHQQSNAMSGKESFHDTLDYHSFDECETKTLNVDKELDGFDDIHELFIGKVGEETSREFMSFVDAHHGESMDNFISHPLHEQYTPTLIQHNHSHQNSEFLNKGQVNPSRVDGCKAKGGTMFEIPFQNVSCNKGPSNKECAPKRKTASIVSSARRQTLLKDTLNRPLQNCIEKARLVASLRESIENARTMKDKVAGKAAYDKAISDFTEAVDRLLVDQVSINKDDDISFNDNTYSLDDSKVVRKAAPNPLDALRTPVNKRRMSAQKEIIKEKRLATTTGNEYEDILRPFDENEEIPQLQRTSTFVVIPTKKTDSTKQVLPTPVIEKHVAGVKSYEKTEKCKSKKLNDEQFIKEELNETKLIKARTLQGIDGENLPNNMDADRGDLTNTLGSHKDNDDTAYVSDLSPPLDNDKIYGANFTTFGLNDINEVVLDDDEISVSEKEKNGLTYCRKSAGNTFEINKGDQTFAVHDADGNVDDGTQDILQQCCSHPSDDETLDIVDSLCNIDDESVDLNDFLPLEYDAHTKFPPRTSLDEPWFDNLEDDTKEQCFHECFSSCPGKDIDGKSMPDETNTNLDQVENYENRSKTQPTDERYIADTTQDVDQSKNGQTVGLVSHGIGHNTENHSDHCDLEPARLSGCFENLHETLVDETKKGVTFERDVSCPVFSDQEDQTDILPLREEVQMQPDNLHKIAEDSNYGTAKSEASPKESLFSTSSSTSGEYSLLNAATRRGTVSVTPFSEIYPATTDGESVKQEIESTQNPIFRKGFPRPSEMLVREKSANSIEEISVENPKIFHPLNDFPSAYVMKVDNDSVRKTLFSDNDHYAVFQTTDTNIENSINDLRKTAKGCLGPLRQKVAFFENIEKALQCQDTLTQHSTDDDCRPVNGDNLGESPVDPDGDKSGSYVNNTFSLSEKTSSKSQQNKVYNIPVVLKESAVQTLMESQSPLEDQETQTTGLKEVVEKGQQCDFFREAEPDLKTLVDDLKERVLASNNWLERLHDNFEETASNASDDRERMYKNLETLNHRIHSNEAEILARVSNVEDSVQTSTRAIGHSIQLIKDELTKLRCDTAEHFDCLKQHSGEMALQKKDLDVLEENIARQFKEHMDKVHCDLQKLQELKPGPSSSTTEIPDTAKQSSIDDLRIRFIEMKNQRDAEKMYHKITRESMRALERDHDRLRQEVLMAATRRHLADRKKSFRLHSLAEESTIADIEVPQLTSTPRKGSDAQRKDTPIRKADVDICGVDSKENITTETAKSASYRKKERKATKTNKMN